jgi:exopolysaccharide production protein ExoZ
MASRTYYNIQALRALAALSITILHAGELVFPNFKEASRPFFSGVDVFFVISGSVMVITTHETWEKPGTWLPFLWRRMVRIVPLYWLLTLLVVSLSRSPAGTWHVVASFLFIPAWNSSHYPLPVLPMGWTLQYEMFFYSLFSLALGLRIRPVYWLSGILAVGSVVGPLHEKHDWAIATLLNPMLMEFVFGMWVGVAVVSGRFLPARTAFVLIPVSLFAIAASYGLLGSRCE